MDVTASAQDAVRKRKRSISEESESRGIQQPQPSGEFESLCEVCQQVDFSTFFKRRARSHSKEIRLGPVAHVFTCNACSICRHMSALLLRHEDNKDAHSEAVWLIKHSVMPGEEQFRLTGVEDVYRIALHIRYKRKNQAVGFLYSCNQDNEYRGPNLHVVREPVQSVFDPDLLRSWLEADMAARSSTQESVVEPMVELLQSGRLRVLDVHTRRVVVLRSHQPYFALSYVWGPEHRPPEDYLRPITPDPGSDVVTAFDPAKAPSTIRDAALLVHSIGHRYLWVDAVCVDQKETVHKNFVISRMDTVYGQATATIVAANGEDAEAGLERLHSNPRLQEFPVGFCQNNRSYRLLPAPGRNLSQAIEASVWNTRGWTYQERMLSKRCVIFTSQEVFLTTPLGHYQESYRLVQPRLGERLQKKGCRRTGAKRSLAATLAGGVVVGAGDLYRTSLEEYSGRILTFPSDRLNAFAGILNSITRVSGQVGDMALFGLLNSKSFTGIHGSLHGLLWKAIPNQRHTPRSNEERIFPSWSWTGWSGKILLHDCPPEFQATRIDANNIKIFPIGSDIMDVFKWPFDPRPCPAGNPQNAVLHLWLPVLRGRVKEIKLQPFDSAAAIYVIQHDALAEFSGPSGQRGSDIEVRCASVEDLGVNTFQEMMFIPTNPYLGFPHSCCGQLMFIRRQLPGEFHERLALAANDVSFWYDAAYFRHVRLI